jgi:hypothetical protein
METRFVTAHLLWLRCETCLVSARLLSSSSITVQKFSPTLPTRTHAHQLLNTWESKGFEDLKQVVLHAVLLAPDPLGGFCNTYEYTCVATGTVADWRKEHLVENILLAFFFMGLGKWETFSDIDRLPLPHMQDAHS